MSCLYPLHAYDALSPSRAPGEPRRLVFLRLGQQPPAGFEELSVPCGQCIECRLQRSREWATRCMLEAEASSSVWFVTLTYDDNHLPVSYSVDSSTGEAFPVMTLVPDDLQKFIKRLRRFFSYRGCTRPIRFFAAGEYGDQSFRPHYHLILFNLPPFPLKYLKVSDFGDPYYTSPVFEKLWPFGNSLVAGASFKSCAYVARYCVKKLTGDAAKFYTDLGITPPFSRMSRRPGIGMQRFSDDLEVFKYDFINIKSSDGGIKAPVPRRYLQCLKEVDPILAEEIADIRSFKARSIDALKSSLTDYSACDIIDIKLRAIESAKIALRRPL